MALVTAQKKPLAAGSFDAFFAEMDKPEATKETAIAAALGVPASTTPPASTGATSGFDAFFKVADAGNAAQAQTAFDLGKSGSSVQDAVAQALTPPPAGGTNPPAAAPVTDAPAADPNMPAGQDPRAWGQMDWESRNIVRRQSGMAYQEPQPEADRKADQARAATSLPPPPPPPPPISSQNVAAPNQNNQNAAAMAVAPPTAAGNTTFAKSQDAGTQSLIQRQDAETQKQNQLVQNLVYNSNRAGQQAVDSLRNPLFRDPNINTNFGSIKAGARQQSGSEFLMEQALQNALLNSTNSPAYQAQLQQYNTQAEEDQQNLLGLLQSTGNLRGSGTATEQMSKYYGGVSQGRANLLAQQDQARQNAIAQAMSLSGMNQSNELATGQLMGNLRGAQTLQAQQAGAQAQMDLANMYNQNQQFGANYNLQKIGLGQDVANQELNRAMTVTSPTQREYFTQAQNQNMIGNELARAGLTGTLNGQQTMAGQANQANVTGQNLANQNQLNTNNYQNDFLQQQYQQGQAGLTGMNLANQSAQGMLNFQPQMLQSQLDTSTANLAGMNTANSTAAMLQGGLLTQQQQQNRILQSQSQLAQQQADLDKSLQTGVIDQQTYQTESMKLQNTAQGYQNTNMNTANQFQRQQLQQGLDTGTANLRGMNLQNDQSQAMNPLLQQALGLQNTGQGYQNQLMEQDYTQQIQMFPEQLRQLDLQGRGMELGNQGLYNQNQLSDQAYNQQTQLFPEQLRQLGLQGRGMELGNQGQYNQNQLSNQAFNQQSQLFPGQLQQQVLQTRGMQLGNQGQYNQNQLLDQSYNQQEQLFPGQLQQQGLQTRGMQLGNETSYQQGQSLLQDRNQNAQLFPGQLTQQGQQTRMNAQQIGGYDQQQMLDRIAQIIGSQNAGIDLGQDPGALIRQALGLPPVATNSRNPVVTPEETAAKANPGTVMPDGSWYDQYGRKHFPGEVG